MKKILLIAVALICSVAASAVDVNQLRIYINPGHGSWTPNDRPCPLVGHGAYSRVNTDTLSFFESNTNLRKGLALLSRLRDYGLKFDDTKNQSTAEKPLENWKVGPARDLSNNIVMARITKTTAQKTNLPLMVKPCPPTSITIIAA